MDVFEKLAWTLAVFFIYVAVVIGFGLLTQSVNATYFTAGVCFGGFACSFVPELWF